MDKFLKYDHLILHKKQPSVTTENKMKYKENFLKLKYKIIKHFIQ